MVYLLSGYENNNIGSPTWRAYIIMGMLDIKNSVLPFALTNSVLSIIPKTGVFVLVDLPCVFGVLID